MMTLAEIPEMAVWPEYSRYSPVFKRRARLAWQRRYGNLCLFCRRGMQFNPKRHRSKCMATIDHINAKAFGGTDDLSNLQIICQKCNEQKAALESLLIQEGVLCRAPAIEKERA